LLVYCQKHSSLLSQLKTKRPGCRNLMINTQGHLIQLESSLLRWTWQSKLFLSCLCPLADWSDSIFDKKWRKRGKKKLLFLFLLWAAMKLLPLPPTICRQHCKEITLHFYSCKLVTLNLLLCSNRVNRALVKNNKLGCFVKEEKMFNLQ
jgi:hypothetical protein